MAAVLRGAMLAARSGPTAFNSRAGVLPLALLVESSTVV